VDINLTAYEARVIGALIEKEITTPDHIRCRSMRYQRVQPEEQREPVMELDEARVRTSSTVSSKST
jgi:uncharacterized protein YceH (UPF0502 family)